MPDDGIERRLHPSQLPVYKHLSTTLTLGGLGGVLIRQSYPICGAFLLIGSAAFLVLAVRSVFVRRRVDRPREPHAGEPAARRSGRDT